ncbi:MAG: ribosome small subunit-dependent GTPase A [Clostridia bacterium]|nr:ribosome small subunit-dependent GTPase A [Deltaproteobacteria bacterium]
MTLPLFFANQVPADSGLIAARVTSDGKAEFWLTGTKAKLGIVDGKQRALGIAARPVVGDWVLAEDREDRAIIHRVLDRKTKLIRKAAGREGAPQVIAANIDVIFIVTSANEDLNVRRLERYLALVHDSGARPVVVINKIDLAADAKALIDDTAGAMNDVDVIGVSANVDAGADALLSFIAEDESAALIGSSGVGKSSITNRLLGREAQSTASLMGRDRGRHTTTRRELFVLPNGVTLIDTPGMRELGLGEVEDGLAATFQDIDDLATDCRFSDCKHEGDPGCAVEAAAETGALDAERFASYRKLKCEVETAKARNARGRRSR